jgi:hypothetical protein
MNYIFKINLRVCHCAALRKLNRVASYGQLLDFWEPFGFGELSDSNEY